MQAIIQALFLLGTGELTQITTVDDASVVAVSKNQQDGPPLVSVIVVLDGKLSQIITMPVHIYAVANGFMLNGMENVPQDIINLVEPYIHQGEFRWIP